VIAESDRATRSMWDGLQILKEIIDAGATIRALDRAYIDLTSPIGRGFMAFISVMAEDERLRMIKRTHEGRAIARENGVKMGPKFRFNDVLARQRLANGEPADHQSTGIHWLHHAHASHAIDNGAPITVVSATLGHADLKTTSIYAHARPGESRGRYLKTKF
jgi:site-specific recombinase XerD